MLCRKNYFTSTGSNSLGLAFGSGVIIINVSFVNFLSKQIMLTIDFNTLSDNRKRALQVFKIKVKSVWLPLL